MQAFGFLTLGILMLVFVELEIVSSNPCSQFSEPDRQSLCSSENSPLVETIGDD